MKGEIRGLYAGDYFSDSGEIFLRVLRVDGGVVLELVDLEGDIFYSVLLDEGKMKCMEIGSAFPSFEDDID